MKKLLLSFMIPALLAALSSTASAHPILKKETGLFPYKSYGTLKIDVELFRGTELRLRRATGSSRNCNLYVKKIKVDYVDGSVEILKSHGRVVPGFKYGKYSVKDIALESISITAKSSCRKISMRKRFKIRVILKK